MKHPVSFFPPCGDCHESYRCDRSTGHQSRRYATMLRNLSNGGAALEFRLCGNSVIVPIGTAAFFQTGEIIRQRSAEFRKISEIILDTAGEKKSDPSRFISRRHTSDI